MDYVRPVDFAAFASDRFSYQILAETETCLITIVRQPKGTGGPERHYHVGDQLYYMLEGRLALEIGGEDHVVEPGGLAFIAAGTAHAHRALSDEIHIDVISPVPSRGRPLAYRERDNAMAIKGGGQAMPHEIFLPRRFERPAHPVPSYVVSEADIPFSGTDVPGFEYRRLANRKTGSAHVALNVAIVSPGTGPKWHIHDFDQFYYVLEGTLTVEIADRHHEVTPHQLVVLPAGVPHRNWNAGDTAERHLAMLVPEPATRDRPLDTPVNFSVAQV